MVAIDMETKKAKNILNKLKPILIVILIFSFVFFLRAETANISGVPDQMKYYYQEDSGIPYFSEMDSYYNYRLTENLLDHGYVGDTRVNGTEMDLHSFYPPGKSVEGYSPMISWITVFFYKVANLFGDFPLLLVSFWTSAIIASLCVIPAYFFIRRLTNDYGGIAAAVLVGVSTFYFSHTFAGFFDTDMFNVLISILVIWFLSESITATEEKKKILYGVFSAISMLVFSLSWEGWWYIFYLAIVAVVVYALVAKFIFNVETFKSWSKYTSKVQWLREQPVILPLLIFVVLSSLLMIVFWGGAFFSSLMGPFTAVSLQSSTTSAAYPNVYVSVGELRIPPFYSFESPEDSVVVNVGGIIPFAIGILGLLMLFWYIGTKKTKGNEKQKALKAEKPRRGEKSRRKKARKRRNARKKIGQEEAPEIEENKNRILGPGKRGNYLYYAILFSLWLLITAYAFTKGVRFVEMFAIPVALCAGIFVGFISDYLKNHIKKPSYHIIAMAVVLVLVCYMPVSSANTVANSIVPGTDDGMVNTLSWIKNNTPQNTVITSWWDFGHLFTAKADRPVTFDGSTQNNGRAYWVAKALYTSNENLSAGILRMLSSSGDDGYIALENHTHDTGKTVEILDKILPEDKATAQNILTTQYGFTAEQAQKILQYTHPDNVNPDLLVTSVDMVGKATWWSYFGSWDFSTNNSTNYGYFMAPANATSDNNSVTIQSENVTVQINGTNATGGLKIGNRVYSTS
jgi:asparagine N-glycosylation enzyme membrane subunit Stt3